MWDLIVSGPDHCLSFYFVVNVCVKFSVFVDNESIQKWETGLAYFYCKFDAWMEII